ncbi:hypothetical protein BC832DRAFT_615494 [Gaertneriomyces semiglobifer]|nr:hypothetical protein BC832DRAFT_615494 [Gaertneriomyces semiglobifer]
MQTRKEIPASSSHTNDDSNTDHSSMTDHPTNARLDEKAEPDLRRCHPANKLDRAPAQDSDQNPVDEADDDDSIDGDGGDANEIGDSGYTYLPLSDGDDERDNDRGSYDDTTEHNNSPSHQVQSQMQFPDPMVITLTKESNIQQGIVLPSTVKMVANTALEKLNEESLFLWFLIFFLFPSFPWVSSTFGLFTKNHKITCAIRRPIRTTRKHTHPQNTMRFIKDELLLIQSVMSDLPIPSSSIPGTVSLLARMIYCWVPCIIHTHIRTHAQPAYHGKMQHSNLVFSLSLFSNSTYNLHTTVGISPSVDWAKTIPEELWMPKIVRSSESHPPESGR